MTVNALASRSVWLDTTLDQLPAAQEQEWRRWLTHHGMPDPLEIPVPSEIICDDDARTVTCERIKINERGLSYTDPATGLQARERITVQLQAPALPFPDGYGRS